MKLEQAIQRSQKSSKEIIGQNRKSDYVTEWQLIYHEVLDISNTFREITNAKVIEHMETCHYELARRKSELFDQIVNDSPQFLEKNDNHFNLTQNLGLHNLVSMSNVDKLYAHCRTKKESLNRGLFI